MKQGVVAVILRGGRFLVIRRAPDVRLPGYWAPPSGKIEPGETQAQAVAREIREEVGLDVVPIEKVWECPTDDGVYTLHWWTAESPSGDLTLQASEVSDAKWVDAEEYFALSPLFDGDREFVTEIWPKLRR